LKLASLELIVWLRLLKVEVVLRQSFTNCWIVYGLSICRHRVIPALPSYNGLTWTEEVLLLHCLLNTSPISVDPSNLIAPENEVARGFRASVALHINISHAQPHWGLSELLSCSNLLLARYMDSTAVPLMNLRIEKVLMSRLLLLMIMLQSDLTVEVRVSNSGIYNLRDLIVKVGLIKSYLSRIDTLVYCTCPQTISFLLTQALNRLT